MRGRIDEAVGRRGEEDIGVRMGECAESCGGSGIGGGRAKRKVPNLFGTLLFSANLRNKNYFFFAAFLAAFFLGAAFFFVAAFFLAAFFAVAMIFEFNWLVNQFTAVKIETSLKQPKNIFDLFKFSF